jgi:hypothetical protein
MLRWESLSLSFSFSILQKCVFLETEYQPLMSKSCAAMNRCVSPGEDTALMTVKARQWRRKCSLPLLYRILRVYAADV